MHVRFADPALERLFESAFDDAESAEAIRAFIGVIEAVKAARDLDDLRALASLDARESGGGVLTMRVEGSLRLGATVQEGDDGSILRVDVMTDTGDPTNG